ncbi:MAG: YbjQ family protein [Candidatus Zixiibacteriota bacterium]
MALFECPNCYARITYKTRVCPKCGNEIKKEDKFGSEAELRKVQLEVWEPDPDEDFDECEPSRSSVVVSTTPTLEGWEIDKYLGVISSHVVAGTNIFADLFAAVRDIVGGRSRSYQKQLRSIHEEAIALLQEQAEEMGATCIVGLTVDHDSISSAGKEQMFMVTAMGTAVVARLREKGFTAGESVNPQDSDDKS